MSILNSKHQVTIPKPVRDALGLGAGDRIEFLLGPDGDVRVRRPVAPDAGLRALEGSLAAE